MTQSMRMRVELISKYSPKPPHIPNSILSVSDLHNLFDIFQSTPFYPALTGSKTPTQKFSESKEVRWGLTARKSPIGSTNDQWGMNKTPTDQSFTL